MGNPHHASIKGVCLVLFLTTFLSGCAGSSSGGGYDSPRALIRALHEAIISGDQETRRLCVAPRDRDRFPMDAALAALGRKYIRKVDVAAKLIEEKLGKEVATRFRRKSLWTMYYSPFDDPAEEGPIQWKRIDIRVEAEKAWVDVDGKEVLQAIKNPDGRWFATVPRIKYLPQSDAYTRGLMEGGIEDMDNIVRRLNAGKTGEEYVLRRIMWDESSQWRRSAAAMINARTTKLLPGTKAVGAKGLRMLPARPFDAGGFVAWLTIKSELKHCNVEVLYAHAVETEVSISIDAGKPIKVRLPKTPHGGKEHTFASVVLGPLSEGKHKVHVYASHNSGVSNLDWVLLVRTQWRQEEMDEKDEVMTMTAGESSQGSWGIKAAVYANTAKLLPGTKAVGRTGLRMLPARPFDAGGFVASITGDFNMKNSSVCVVYANPVDTEVSISIDGGKPIKVRLPKTPPGEDYAFVFASVGPLSKGKHKVHVYATHSSGVSNLDSMMFGQAQPNKKTVAP